MTNSKDLNKKIERTFNADFEGVMPGADQAIYDAVNEKAKYKLTDMSGGMGVILEPFSYQLPRERISMLPSKDGKK